MSGRPSAGVSVVLAAVALSGCGSAAHGAPPSTSTRPAGATGAAAEAPRVPPAVEYARMQTADCSLWGVLDAPSKARLLADFRAFFGAGVDAASRSGLRGGALSDARARRVFDSYCRLPFASAFKLYKLYGRSAALGGADGG